MIGDFIDTHTLEWQRAVARTGVAEEFLRNVTMHSETDFIRDQLILTMEKYILREHVLADSAQVPVSGTLEWPPSFLVAIPRSWWQRLLRRPARTIWVDVVGRASVGDVEQAEVSGTVTVRADYFASYPESKIMRDPRMGHVVRMVTMAEPDVTWTPPPVRQSFPPWYRP